MIAKRLERGCELGKMVFNNVDLWVQIWGLLHHNMIVQMGREIGSCMGEVKEAAVFDMEGSNRHILKVLVALNIQKRLRKGVNARSKADGVF